MSSRTLAALAAALLLPACPPGDPNPAPDVAVTVTPAAATVGPGEPVALSAEAEGVDAPTFDWRVDGIPGGDAAVGTVGADGGYVAPLTFGALDGVTVTAHLADQPAVFGAATITFDASTPSLSIATPDPVVPVGGQRGLLAGSVGLDRSRLRWALSTTTPRSDIGAIDPVTGLYTAPATLPDPPIDRIEVTVRIPGDALQASTSLTVQELSFDPPEVELLDPGATATFDLREVLSTGADRSLLDAPEVTWSLENPDPPVASVDGDTVTALDPVGQAKLIATDARTGAVAGLTVANVGRPSLAVDEDGLVHGVPGLSQVPAVALRIARTGLADQGVDVSGNPELVIESLDPFGAVAAPDAPPPALAELVAYYDVAARRFVYGHHPGTAPFRVTHTGLGISADFVVELSPTWLVGWGRAPVGLAPILEVGVVPDGGDAPFTGHDVSVARDHLGADWQDLIVMLWGADKDDPRWSFWRTADLGTQRVIRWEVLEGHGTFVGAELAGQGPFGFTTADLATGVYADGPLAGQAWATRSLGKELLDEYLVNAYGDGTFWDGQRGAFVRFVATAPGPVVVEATLVGSDLEPVRWTFDAKPPVLETIVRSLYDRQVGSAVTVDVAPARHPDLPQVLATPDVARFPPWRVEIRRPSGDLLPADAFSWYRSDGMVDRVALYLDEAGTWDLRLAFTAGDQTVTTAWSSFEATTLDDFRAGLAPGGRVMRMTGQAPLPFAPDETLVTFRAVTPAGFHDTAIITGSSGQPSVDAPGLVHDPQFREVAPFAQAGGDPQPAGLFTRWRPAGPYLFSQDLVADGGTLDDSVGVLWPAEGSSTLTLILERDPATAWNPLAHAPATPNFGGTGQGVIFDPPYLYASPRNCLTPAVPGQGLVGTWQTTVEVRGNDRFEAALGALTADDVSVVGAPWLTATAVSATGPRSARIDLDADLDLVAAPSLFGADAFRLRVVADGATFEAPFRLYRVWLSGWQPDLPPDAQTDDDGAVGLPLNARFAGHRDASMPAELHVQGDARQVALTWGTSSDSGRVVAATARRDLTVDDDRVIDHAPLTAAPARLVADAVPGAPSSTPITVYGSVVDAFDGATGDAEPDGLPDEVSEAPDDERLWVRCDGRVADTLPFTAFNYVARPVGPLRTPDPQLGARDADGAAAYADANTFAGADGARPDLDVTFDVDSARPGHLSLINLAHRADAADRAEGFDGAHLGDVEEGPTWLAGASGDGRAFGIELDGLCFDPDLEFTPTGDEAPNAAALFPPGDVPALTASGFLDDAGGASGGHIGERGDARGRYWLVAETPGARWPGLDCAYPLRGSRDAIAAETDDLDGRLLEADADGRVDLDDPDARVAAFSSDHDANDGINAGLRVDGRRFAWVWTTDPERAAGQPILAADLEGAVLVGERARPRAVAPGDPGYHPDGTCTPGLDDDLVVTARRATGGAAEARLVGKRVAVDTLVGALTGIAFAVALPTAVGSTLLYASGQAGIGLLTSYVSEANHLDSGSSAVVGKVNSKGASAAAARAARWGARVARVGGSNLGTRGASPGRWVRWADEGFSAAGLLISEAIKRYALADGGAEIYGAANAFVAESLAVHIPAQGVADDDPGLRVAVLQAARSLSIDARTDWRSVPPGDVEPIPARGGQTHAYIRRCASAAQSLVLVLTPGGELRPATDDAQATALADFDIVAAGDAGEVWGLARTAIAVVDRSNTGATARARIRADGELFFLGYGLRVVGVRR